MKSVASYLSMLLGAAAFGCTEEAAIPEVPNLDAIHYAYDEPTAVLDWNGVRDVLATFPQLERLAAAFSSAEPLLDGVEGAKDSLGEHASPAAALRGSLETTLHCSGADADPSADAGARGSISLELALDDSRIKPRFWAFADHCALRGTVASAALAVTLDGMFAFDVGSPIPLESKAEWQRERTLMVALGTIRFDQYTLTNVSARFGAGRVEYLHELDTGHVVLLVTADGFGVRDRDTTWFCGRGVPVCARS
jgi:hypothetical protein